MPDWLIDAGVPALVSGAVVAVVTWAIQSYFEQRRAAQLAEHGVTFGALHDRRAKVLGESYGYLVEAEDALQDTRDIQPPPDVIDKRLTAFGDAANTFRTHFKKHRIFFSPETCEVLDEYRKTLMTAGYASMDDQHAHTAEEAEERMKEVRGLMKEDLPRAREALEHECRRILGVEDREDFSLRARLDRAIRALRKPRLVS